MEAFWKAAAIIILTIILEVAIGKTEKDFSTVLTVAACCIVIMVAMQYLSEVVSFLRELTDRFDCADSLMNILLKVSAVALITELTCLISADAGNSSLGKVMHILGNAVILFLSLPLFDAFFQIIQEIMGKL